MPSWRCNFCRAYRDVEADEGSCVLEVFDAVSSEPFLRLLEGAVDVDAGVIVGVVVRS